LRVLDLRAEQAMSERRTSDHVVSMARIAGRLVEAADTRERRSALLRSVSRMSPIMAAAVLAEMERRVRESRKEKRDG
jgi:hypothetical protein